MVRNMANEADLLDVDQAVKRILSYFKPLDTESVPITKALGRTLADTISSPFNIPLWPNSAMDGYAVRHSDIIQSSIYKPTFLKVKGMIAAGDVAKATVIAGTATRIMTGAPIPPGADTVVPFEETDELERKKDHENVRVIGILSNLTKGAFVRPAGEDLSKGEMVLERRTVLQPAHLGVLSAIGLPAVTVFRKPTVAIISTGDELQAPGKKLRPGKIYDSNGVSISASVIQYGGLPKFLGITRDSIDSINSKLDKALESDMLITSAGVSKGDYDLVKTILEKRGNIEFWSVKMRPAKPLAFGLLNTSDKSKVPHIGLPGNPVSAMVAFEEFCRPAILKMLGQDTLARKRVTAILEDTITNSDGRRVYSRVIVSDRQGHYYARLTGPQGSNLLTSMAKANGLAICPENTPEMKPGQKTEVILLDWPE